MRDVEIPKWLKGLPLAPEFRPTDTEFADPIAYISKIEKEASAFGICKVIPPLPKPSKKYVLHNLNKSLSKCPELGVDGNARSTVEASGNGCEGNNNGEEVRAVFTTRHQELGNSGKRVKALGGNQTLGAHKQVWQSGEVYTIEQFEAKAKNFARNQLGSINDVSPLVIESMFWEAASEKPIYVEYANDVPGTGFGEPEGLFRYFRRPRRRKKRGTFDRNSRASTSNKGGEVATVNSIAVDADLYSKNDSTISKEIPEDSSSVPSTSSDQFAYSNRRKCSIICTDMVGTAGWKLSNSPWNLQVIARSPGSLTKFMPDDIPGVTSPMVYIGMLFSWFAWHVEDHELHSLNYLHMGSPKTWYAVPGDNAFDFEEVTRLHAYGGNTDRLAVLTLLGEKTTLLSPEVVVASGIPCCRLVQNPGEFVVTFPRAYHVGFSHGFNCGEAANFGTPQWLALANEAAVRRAAMNYLPMLSHQQLLYLLTMSFVSRVPRSLLPGVRSSRHRDRQKEERERLIKEAFIEDVVKEKKLLTILLQKSSSYRVVEWDLVSLPSSAKGTELCNNIDTIANGSTETDSRKANKSDLCTEMNLYMDAVDNFYDEDDDLCDFHVDSGPLPCVACGLLGFPFMAVLQPSVEASKDLLDDPKATQNLGTSKRIESHVSLVFNDIVDASDLAKVNPVLRNIPHDSNVAYSFAQSSQSTLSAVEDQFPGPDQSSSSKCEAASAEVKLQKGWHSSNRFSRPRIFCLDHATQTEELLSTRGGANVLVICHSDFRRIRSHVSVVAEEIGAPFCYEDIPFDDTSQEDLNLIDLATDNEEHGDCAEDWTSELNINLQHCMKLRKKSSSMRVPHALKLGGLFSVTNQSLQAAALIWQLKKSRSKRCSNHPVQKIPLVNIQMEMHEDLTGSSGLVSRREDEIQIHKTESRKAEPDEQMAGKSKITIQYSRRKYKRRPCVSTGAGEFSVFPELSGSHSEHLDAKTSTVSECFPSLLSSSREATQLQFDIPLLTDNNSWNPYFSQDADSVAATPAIGIIEAETGSSKLKEPVMDNTFSGLVSHIPQLQQEIKAIEDTEESRRGVFENSSGLAETANQPYKNWEATGMNLIENKVEDAIIVLPSRADDLDIQNNKHDNGDVLMNEVSDSCLSSTSSIDSPSEDRDEQVVKTKETHLGLGSEIIDQSVFIEKEQQGVQTMEVLMKSTFALEEDVEVSKEPKASEDSQNEGGNSEEKRELDERASTVGPLRTSVKYTRKRKRESDLLTEARASSSGFIRSPCESLRPRTRKDTFVNETDCKKPTEEQTARKRADKVVLQKDANQQDKESHGSKDSRQQNKGPHRCDLESCRMSFQTKAELLLHKRNRCHYQGCGKTFSAHKYVILHQRVHDDDRPLKCPWKGCTMSFKWAWARTEHMRVHTGERPYKCKVDGCDRTFRFVSDYSRHRRKTGHYVN